MDGEADFTSLRLDPSNPRRSLPILCRPRTPPSADDEAPATNLESSTEGSVALIHG